MKINLLSERFQEYNGKMVVWTDPIRLKNGYYTYMEISVFKSCNSDLFTAARKVYPWKEV